MPYKDINKRKECIERYNLEHKEEIKKAFAPENHQWLLAEENWKKSGKWDGE